MAWTAPKTWSVNEVVTAANVNTHLRDNLNWLANDKPRCKANRTSVQSIADVTNVAVNLNAADSFDVGTMHDTVTNNTRLTVPTGGGGQFTFGAQADWLANANGFREAGIRLNGTTILARVRMSAAQVSATVQNVSGTDQLAAGDFLELVVHQSSGGALDLTSSFLWAHWMGF